MLYRGQLNGVFVVLFCFGIGKSGWVGQVVGLDRVKSWSWWTGRWLGRWSWRTGDLVRDRPYGQVRQVWLYVRHLTLSMSFSLITLSLSVSLSYFFGLFQQQKMTTKKLNSSSQSHSWKLVLSVKAAMHCRSSRLLQSFHATGKAEN